MDNNLIELLKKNKFSYQIVDNVIIIDNNNFHVNLSNLKEINYDVIFNNRNILFLTDLKEITTNIEFNNQGYIDLCNVQTISGNVIFNNEGYIYLNRLKEITGNVKFKNNIIKLYINCLNLNNLTYKTLIDLYSIENNRQEEIFNLIKLKSSLNIDMLL